ncbi:MAG: hypothetical protein QHH00_08440 [Methanomassiliicoccales archaeon]|nr:hypothetical protein [Methanomassiliicoccales archaeon]
MVDGSENELSMPRAYNSNHQILLAESAMDLAEKLKSSEKPVRLQMVDSPNLPDGEAVFSVTTEGVKD